MDKNDKIKVIDEYIESIKSLPSHALSSSITHYDLLMIIELIKRLID